MKSWITTCGSLLALSCSAPSRSVPVGPEVRHVELERTFGERVEMRAPRRANPPAPAPFLPDEPASRPSLSTIGVTSSTGWRLETGVGMAPYDDAGARFDLLPVDRPGFSDTVVRVSWTRAMRPGLQFVTSAAATRLQDLPVLDSINYTELAWVTFGLQVSF